MHFSDFFKPFNLLILILYFSCSLFFIHINTPRQTRLDAILESDKITVITSNNSNCYYFYRDGYMGFEYDMVKAFAEYLGVELEVMVADKWEDMVSNLNKGAGDFIAANIFTTENRQKDVVFSKGYMEIEQYAIIHRNNRGIKKISDLNGKTIYVRRGTSYQEQLESIKNRELDFTVKLVEDLPTEELLRRVAKKDIKITIADTNIALLNRRYFPAIKMACSISQKENLGWAVKAGNRELIEKINLFFDLIKENGRFEKIYNRYYEDIDSFDYVDMAIFHRRLKARLPRYRSIIMETSEKYGFDWRLIAAQIYQESHFNIWAKSPAGAYGLMQLTHSTAKSLGVKEIYDSSQNINAGVEHLRNLYDHFDKSSDSDRLLISLAAYNVGQGHIWDAMNLSRKKGLDPYQWQSIMITLPLLRYKKYYQKAAFGYCRGTEPVNYVKRIMVYYDILKYQGVKYKAFNKSSSPLQRDYVSFLSQ